MNDIRTDGFFNAFLGYGTRRRDPFTHTHYGYRDRNIEARWREYEDLFTYNGIAQKLSRLRQMPSGPVSRSKMEMPSWNKTKSHNLTWKN